MRCFVKHWVKCHPKKQNRLFGDPGSGSLEGCKPRHLYAFIKEYCDDVSISLACMALGVRREGYHVWLKVELSGTRQIRQAKDDELLTSLKKIKAKNKKYGTLRLRRGLDVDATSHKRPSYGKVYKLCGTMDYCKKCVSPKA